MKKWLKITIIVSLAGLIGAGLGYKYVYNKPHTNYEKANPDFNLLGQDLFSQYRSKQAEAEQMYNGKVLLVSGILNKIETPDSLTVAVFVLDEGLFGEEGIRLTMLPKFASETNSYLNQNVVLKGYCTGYNGTDVILEKCSIVQD
jgi:hypothetical protein